MESGNEPHAKRRGWLKNNNPPGDLTVLQDAEPRPERGLLAEHQQWQTVGVECTGVKAQALGLERVLNGQGKLTGNMVTIQPNQ